MKRSARRSKKPAYGLDGQTPCWLLNSPAPAVESEDEGDEGGGGGEDPAYFEEADVSNDEDAGSWPMFDDDAGDETSDEDAPQFFGGSDYLRGDSSAPGF